MGLEEELIKRSRNTKYLKIPKEPWMFYCAHCKTKRYLPESPKKADLQVKVQIVITTLLAVCLTYNWFEVKSFVLFIPIAVMFELTHRLRQRAQLRCRHCGFDPMLTTIDRQRSKEDLKKQYDSKLEALQLNKRRSSKTDALTLTDKGALDIPDNHVSQ